MNSNIKKVPPSPDVLSMLYMDYLKYGKPEGLSFKSYLRVIGYVDPAIDIIGMDDGLVQIKEGDNESERIRTNQIPVIGELQVQVLLVDFADVQGRTPPQDYQNLLFSDGIYPTGSMRDYFKEVSLGKVKISGFVHGWFRMPQSYRYYTNGESGTGKSYPKNSQGLVVDAVNAAKNAGVVFPDTLDKLKQGTVTALFIIHAGRGAETMRPPLDKYEIWSHQWVLPYDERIEVSKKTGMKAYSYLVVPQEGCNIGVCAHELGHLVFQWSDFYDINTKDGSNWDGSGSWDLMASGNYNGSSASPAHPVGLHKSQHDWVEIEEVRSSTKISLSPYSKDKGKIIKVISPHYKAGQYLLLENRKKQGFDSYLPGEGLLVWRVDESKWQTNPLDQIALLLIQADGKHHLEFPGGNVGDAGDPFPGIANVTQLLDTGSISTSFPEKRSKVSLKNIKRNAQTGEVTLDVVFEP